jgi:hypothetical protein
MLPKPFLCVCIALCCCLFLLAALADVWEEGMTACTEVNLGV